MELTSSLWWRVAETSLVMACSAVVMTIALRVLRCRSATLSHWVWCCVLFTGVLFWRIPVTLPAVALEELAPAAPVAANLASGDEPGASRVVLSSRADLVGLLDGNDPPRGAMLDRGLASSLGSGQWPAVCLATVWLSGVVVLVLRGSWNYLRFVRHAACAACTEQRWLNEFEEQRAGVETRAPIGLFVSEAFGPALCRLPSGYRIIVPRALWSRLSDRERISVLQHELAHFTRGDLYISVLMHAIAVCHWFNPVSWFVLRRVEMFAEYACDDMVCSRGGTHATALARALVEMGQSPESSPAFSAGLGRSSLAYRIRRCVSSVPVRDSIRNRVLLLACVLALVAAHVVRPQLIAQETNASEAVVDTSHETDPPKSRAFQVSDAEFAEAVETIRAKGGFVRTFHPRDSQDHWVQIILEPKSGLLDRGMDDVSIDEELLGAIRALSLDSPTHLHARGCSFLVNDLRMLEHARLTRLELEGLSIRDQHLMCVPHLPELSELFLENTRVSDFGISLVSQCTSLTSMGFRDNAALDASALRHLRKLSNLTSVEWLEDLSPAVAKQLNAISGLQKLRLRLEDPAAASSFKTLTCLAALKSLELSGAAVTEAELIHVATSAPMLGTLYLRGCQGATLDAMRHVATLTELETLALSSSNVTDAGVAMLKPLSQLRWLDLSGTNINDRSLLIVGNMSDLRFLHLMRTNVTEDGLERLRGLEQLVHLNVQGTYVKSIPEWLLSREKLHLTYDEQPQTENGLTELAVAVDEFNRRAAKNPTGKFEPPLTAAEVIAAIRSWNRQQSPVEDNMFAVYQNIASTEKLPPGARLSFSTNWLTPQYHYQVWWIDLDVRSDENHGYTFRLRSRTVSSRAVE